MRVAQLRPRGASHASAAAVSDGPVLPRTVDASQSPSPTPMRRYKRVMVMGCVLYTALLLAWFVIVHGGEDREVGVIYTGNFISASSVDDAQWNYLHEHEGRGLQSEFEFAELELEFLHKNVTVEKQDAAAVAEAEAHRRTLKDFPTWEDKMRRIRCIGWRATDKCSPDGPRLPSLDEACNSIIPFGASGFCEVQDKDTGERFRVMKRHCSSVRDTARFRCSELWDFAVFPQKAQEVVRKAQQPNFALPNIAQKASKQQEPRDGIVMVVYPKLLASAYATIRALRELLDCQLPIELWYRLQEMRYFPSAFEQLQQWSQGSSITFREIGEPGVTSFSTKVFAIYHSAFERVLFLDADNTPVRNPAFLFDSAEFTDAGAVFWPDFWHPSRSIFNIQPHSMVWELLDLPFVSMFEQESGQLLVDRRRHAVPLELVKFFTFHRPNHFDKLKLAHGDKDLFRFAWLKLGVPFHMIQTPPSLAGKVINGSFCGMTMVQYDAHGEILFLHRNSHKLMGVPRRKGINMKAAAIRRARNKRLRKQMAEADRVTLNDKSASTHAPEETPSPTLESPEPDGYPDMAIWSHLVSFRNTSSRSDYYVETYNADPEFDKGQNCYGTRYLNQSQHFVVQEFADLHFAGLESELRRFAMEGAKFYEKAGLTGR